MLIASGERKVDGDTSLGEDGLGLSRALRRRVSDLFDQQMWCWGRDVRHDEGDVLQPSGSPHRGDAWPVESGKETIVVF
jgi:hypothetical protein